MDEQAKNLNQALLAAMDTYAGRTCLQVKQSRRYQNISYRRFQALAFRMAKFFRHQGIVNGERVAIVIDNCLEWMVCYVACLLSGGVIVPLPTTVSPYMLRFILQDSGARLAILQEPPWPVRLRTPVTACPT
jgi:long-chain acyl-CoA synthetase